MEEEEFVNVLFLHLKIFFFSNFKKSLYCNFPLKQKLDHLYIFYGQLWGVSGKLCECFNDLN